MILVSHVAVGVALATGINNSLLCWPIAFGAHFMTDLLPHWDFLTGASKEEAIKPWRWVGIIFDIVCGLTLGLFFVFRALWFKGDPSQALNILGACFFSVLPDLLEFPRVLLGKRFLLSDKMLVIQKKCHVRMSLPWGLVPELLLLALLIFPALK